MGGSDVPLITTLGTIFDAQPDAIGAIFSFANVTFMSSAALNALVSLNKKLTPSGGKIVIHDIKLPAIRAIFKTTRLDKVFTIVDDEEAALAVFKN